MQKPIVSICCITYNHAPFIRKCIDGFLMQKTSFSFEILIHDDCSTDGTDLIIKEYAEKYPNLIFPLYEEFNQYSLGGSGKMDMYNYRRSRAKYIATCEGDDYWTDPYKLQKQYDFMESHPDYSVCFHCYQNYNVYTDSYIEPNANKLIKQYGDCDYITLDYNMVFDRWVTMQLTMFFKVDRLDFSIREHYKYYRDTHEVYHLMQTGKCALLSFNGAVRNMHIGGVASMIPSQKLMNGSLQIAFELYNNNKDDATKKYLHSMLIWALQYCSPLSYNRIRLSYKIYKIKKDFWSFVKNLLRR